MKADVNATKNNSLTLIPHIFPLSEMPDSIVTKSVEKRYAALYIKKRAAFFLFI